MPPSWLNPAGGLRYHLRALTSQRYWLDFRGSLATWLAEFEPSSSRALLVGPSAGYTFPDAFLQRFEAITVLEPDPLAAFAIGRRLRRLGIAELRIERSDRLLALRDGASGLAELLRADPERCLIFGNVLGQTRFLLEESEFERFKAAFRERVWPLLGSRAWLSFHDRLSGSLVPSFRAPYRAPSRLGDAALLSELYGSAQGAQGGELFDHQSDGFFPNHLSHVYFAWRIDRARYHLIEGVAAARGEELRDG